MASSKKSRIEATVFPSVCLLKQTMCTSVFDDNFCMVETQVNAHHSSFNRSYRFYKETIFNRNPYD